MSEVEPPPDGAPRRAAFVFIFVTVALDMLALGIIIPILPKLVLQFEGGESGSAAFMMGVFGTLYAAMQFLCAPLLGVLSDRIGRRPVVLISNLGLGLDYILMAVAPSIGWLLLGRVIAGVCGASFGTAGAYIADITPVEQRAKSFGRLATAFGLGFIVGPAFGGLLGDINPRLPFVVAAGLSLANWLYGLLILPESLDPSRRSASFDLAKANPVAALGFLRQAPGVLGLAVVAFVCDIAHEVLPTTYVLYVDYRFHWSTATIGLSLATVGIASAVVQGGLIGPFVKRFGERTSLIAGLFFGAFSFFLFGAAARPAIFWLALPINCLMGLWRPAAQSLLSAQVDPSSQGRLQGALSSLQGVAFMIGPGLFTSAFAIGVGSKRPDLFAGAPYFIAALLMTAAIAIASRAQRSDPGPRP